MPKDLSLKVPSSQYYGVLASILFAVIAVRSIVVGICVFVLLLLFYSLFLPVLISLANNKVHINSILRKRCMEPSTTNFRISTNDKRSFLHISYKLGPIRRNTTAEVSDPAALRAWFEDSPYELTDAT